MTTKNATATYSSKSTAIRGAKRLGLPDGTFTVEKTPDGRFEIIPQDAPTNELETAAEHAAADALLASALASGQNLTVEGPGNTEGETTEGNENGQAADADAANEGPVAEMPAGVATPEKAKTYKEIANYNRSTVMKPLEMIHAYLDANPNLSRKAAVTALVEQGINYSTARTQYQRWFAKRKG